MSTSIFQREDKAKVFVPLCDALRALGAKPSGSRLKKDVEYTNSTTNETFKTNVLAFITDREYLTVKDGKKTLSSKVVNISFSKKLADEIGPITKEWFRDNYKTANCSLADGKDDWLVISANSEFTDDLADCEW
jgi:hypothetical protein